MRGLFRLSGKSRAVVGVAVGAVAMAGALVPLTATPALATLSATTFIGDVGASPASAVANANGVNFPNEGNVVVFTMRTNSPVKIQSVSHPSERHQVRAVVTSGPDTGRFFECSPYVYNANGNSIFNRYVPTDDKTDVACFVANDFSKGLGVDTYRFFVDRDDDGGYDVGEPFTTGQATYVGTPSTLSLTAASSAAQDTCTPISVSLLDTAGRHPLSTSLRVELTQPGATTATPAQTPSYLDFCDTAPVVGSEGEILTLPSGRVYTTTNAGVTNAVRGFVSTGDADNNTIGVAFGIRAHDQQPVTVKVFYDANGDNNSNGDPVDTKTLTINPGLQNGGTQLTLTAPSPYVDRNHFGGGSVTARVLNAAGNPVAGAKVCYTVTTPGGGGNSIIVPLCLNARTNDDGIAEISYPVPQAEVDTITAFIDYTSGNVGQVDSGEPQDHTTLTVVQIIDPVSVTLTPTGTNNGDAILKDQSTNPPATAIVPAHSHPGDDPRVSFVATVKRTTDNAPIANAVVALDNVAAVSDDSYYPSSNAHPLCTGVGTPAACLGHAVPTGLVNGYTIPTYSTDGNGQVTVTLAPGDLAGSPFGASTRNGYVYTVRASVLGTNAASTPVAFSSVLYQAPKVSYTDSTSAAFANRVRSIFPSTIGSMSVSPTDVTTQPHTAQVFTVTVKDQFGVPAGNVPIDYANVGRNGFPLQGGPYATADAKTAHSTNEQGQLAVPLIDQGTTSSDPNNATTYDVIRFWSDEANDGIDTNDLGLDQQNPVSAKRLYSTSAIGPNDAAAVEGGVGTATEQFSGSVDPFNPVTSDDTASRVVDVANPRSTQATTNVFFEVRNLDNSFHFPGGAVTITSTGVGNIAASNTSGAPSFTSVPVAIDANGFAQVRALSVQTGVQTITINAGVVTKSVSITWTNAGTGRYVAITPATSTIVPTQIEQLTAKVTDVWGNTVAGQVLNFNLSGPGVFAVNNGTSGSVATDATGTVTFGVKSTGAGTITVTATGNGAHFSDPANSPESGKAAGNGVGTATLTSGNGGIPSSATLATTPAGTHNVGGQVTVTGTLKDANGNVVPGVNTKFVVTGVTTLSSSTLVSNANGQVNLQFTSNNQGTANVKLSVYDNSGNELFSQSTLVFFGDPDRAPKPTLTQASSKGVVGLLFQTVPRLQGLTVYFFRRSGITGQVVPLGTGLVDANGQAKRFFFARTGQILALYGKVVGATNIVDPYSNSVAFRVR